MQIKANVINAVRRGMNWRLFVGLLGLAAFAIVSVKGQNASDEGTYAARDLDCINVSLSADSTRLKKDRPAILRVKIRNSCDRSVQIYEPIFYLQRVTNNTKPKYGDEYGGRIIRRDDSEIDNSAKSILADRDMESVLYSNEVRWMDSMSSIDVFGDLFAADLGLKAGNFQLYCTVKICPSCPLDRRNVVSNKLETTIEK